MKLDKIKNCYNDYKLELSWGQIEAIAAALAQNHSDPLADELFAEWQWYMERVPGPGEDEEAAEAQQQAAEQGGQPGEVEGEDLPIPMPPGRQAGTPPDGGEETGPPSDEEMAAAGSAPGKPGLPEPESDDQTNPLLRAAARKRQATDDLVPEPPAE